MRFLNLLRFRKRRSRNSSDDNPAVEKKDEAEGEEGSDSSRERRSEAGGEVGERKTEMEAEPSERKRRIDESSPPADDCCPICFGNFTVPCRAPCGHWYCGDCILQYWNHGAALMPCKCPMCSQLITRLIPEASSDHCHDVEVLQNVRKYNRVFVGGTYGLILKVLESPFLIKRILHEMMDPDGANNHLFKVRLFAILLGALYSVCHFDFLPTGDVNSEHEPNFSWRMDAINFFDNFGIALVLILYVVGLFRRWRRLRLVRQLGADQP